MTRTTESPSFSTFAEFYPYYLSEHQDDACRRLHYAGTSLVILLLLYVLFSQNWLWLLAVPLAGYGFAWVGHFFFEHNKPATFRYPLYSLMGDWVMLRDAMTGRIRF
ncbi:hypothetical protein BXT89_08495 [Halopseudomonas pachastrellae]|uniref:DUF962 domain-containing protein n=1 Tax=Halopseudomonas pachastrellae TaxID=254161 RepID=A0A1S8DFQ1_9GAMM|nr:Mpo1-like protein [Halopseudomonas pachastrellae]ONM44275.1 hypothetical protein BXT89_08495 [Halopseudomonas pachastrellae]SFM68468.1 hypothetical protein SAMN05216256_11772 [Halopseudomonas pachastrellae]